MDDDVTQRRRNADAGDSAPPERTSSASNPFDAAGHLPLELLASYLDDPVAVDGEARLSVEAHLAECADCRAALAELRQIVYGLAALPQPALPRSFALNPAQARQRKQLAAPVPRWWQLVDARPGKLRWATALVSLLFLVVLGGDLLSKSAESPSPAADQVAASYRQSTGADTAAAGGVAESSTHALASEPQATSTAGAAVQNPAAAAPAASPASDAGSTAADSAASPATYALKSVEPTTTSVAAPEAALPSLPPAPGVPTAVTETHTTWHVAETVLALLTAWLLAAMLAIPMLVRRDAGRDS